MLNNIAIEYNPSSEYPLNCPFSPSDRFPECPFKDISQSYNSVYCQVRNVLKNLGLDKENFDNVTWNPFGSFISPGNKVVIKPNWVREKNPLNPDISGLVTHPSVVRAVIDYCIIALKDNGEIVIGDAPIQSADFDLLKTRLQINELMNFYEGKTGISISVKDFRKEIKRYNSSGKVLDHHLIEDKEFVEVDLNEKSFLFPVRDKFRQFRVTNYDPRKMFEFHNHYHNIYVIDKSILDADAVIQIPKLKTHGKAGITCCLKNSVGINCQKDALVHHLKGSKTFGGDAYPFFNQLKWINENLYELREKSGNLKMQRFLSGWIGINDGILKRLHANPIFEGSWYGNHTLWRMILDINNILFYADPKGEIKPEQQRKVFYLVDGIIGGEKEGPLKPDNKFVGLIIGGWNPVLIDLSSASLIGFDFRKITSVMKSLENKLFGFSENDLDGSTLIYNGRQINPDEVPVITQFIPSKGWENHIEAVNLPDKGRERK